MPYDQKRTWEIQDRVDRLHDEGRLTKEAFVEAYLEMEEALGDGPEADGIEAVCNLAPPGSRWIDEADAESARRRRSVKAQRSA